MTCSLSDGRVSTTLSSIAEQKGQRMGDGMLLPLMNELRLTVNGEARTAAAGTTVTGLLAAMGIDPARVAVERNQDVVPRRSWAEAPLFDGDKIEIVAFVGGGSGGSEAADPLVIGGRTFTSRLLVGTGKYRTLDEGREAILRSGAEIVT